jgi:sulfite exporter TauE/SafE
MKNPVDAFVCAFLQIVIAWSGVTKSSIRGAVMMMAIGFRDTDDL